MSKSSWPEAVVRAAVNKSLVLFVGAGVSASCRNDLNEHPPQWEELLGRLAEAVNLDAAARNEFDRLIVAKQLLDAAELLKFTATHNSRLADMTKRLTEAVQGPYNHPYRSSEWHEVIAQINPSVIVTTNYDKILESAPEFNYMVATHTSDDLDSHIRANDPTILKIHGSVDEPSKTILTRTDYARLHKEGALSLSVVRALMTTRTFLFVGYSLSDPDLQALLQDVFAARPNHNVSPHYVLAPKSSALHQREVLRYCYGVSAITYDDSKGDYGLHAFQELGSEVISSAPSSF